MKHGGEEERGGPKKTKKGGGGKGGPGHSGRGVWHVGRTGTPSVRRKKKREEVGMWWGGGGKKKAGGASFSYLMGHGRGKGKEGGWREGEKKGFMAVSNYIGGKKREKQGASIKGKRKEGEKRTWQTQLFAGLQARGGGERKGKKGNQEPRERGKRGAKSFFLSMRERRHKGEKVTAPSSYIFNEKKGKRGKKKKLKTYWRKEKRNSLTFYF